MTYEYCCGAVLYTVINDIVKYVLVVESDGHCGLPKGHIESSETEKETVMREIWEETGIHATIIEGFLTKIEYELKNGSIKQTTYYCATYAQQKINFNKDELIDVKLLPFEEALSVLTYQKIKEILIKANEFIMRTA